MEKDNTLKDKKVFSFGLCFHKSGGIMSMDLRDKFKKDDKISMLDKQINQYTDPIIIPYKTENNYYELEVENFEMEERVFNKENITLMIDSGTTFTHLPTRHMKSFLDHLNRHCS